MVNNMSKDLERIRYRIKMKVGWFKDVYGFCLGMKYERWLYLLYSINVAMQEKGKRGRVLCSSWWWRDHEIWKRHEFMKR